MRTLAVVAGVLVAGLAATMPARACDCRRRPVVPAVPGPVVVAPAPVVAAPVPVVRARPQVSISVGFGMPAVVRPYPVPVYTPIVVPAYSPIVIPAYGPVVVPLRRF
ncbi:MAG: hypothetical protein NZ700_03340 [Gemmataceae bacterium]|nr:hypothetical protein [Gemmataceae bacterium]MDW8267084.1 hypothetical protein [Gemmataceae bacterium]